MGLHGALLLPLSFVAASSVPSGPPRVFTLRSTTTEEVPTFYHLTEYKGVVCNGTAFTEDEEKGCHGWHGLSEHDCKMKCAAAEKLEHCPERLCFALSYHSGGGGWCQLYDHANCLGFVSRPYVSTFKKEHGTPLGGIQYPTNISLGAIAMAAGAIIAAGAEMSHRHRGNATGYTGSTVAAGASTAGHLVDASTSVAPGVAAAAAAAQVEKLIGGSTSAAPAVMLPGLPATGPVYAPGSDFSTTVKLIESGAHLRAGQTTSLPVFTDSDSSSFAIPHPLFVIPTLLVAFICCCAIFQALSKRKRRDGDGGSDAEGDRPTRYPNDVE